MISALTGAVAVARRAANEARMTVVEAGKQVATGKRVSKVTDDAATWTRAAAIQRDADLWRWREQEARRLDGFSSISLDLIDDGMAIQQEAARIMGLAALTPANSSERKVLHTDWQALIARQRDQNQRYGVLFAIHGPTEFSPQPEWSIDSWDTDPVLDPLSLVSPWHISQPTVSNSYLSATSAVETNFLGVSEAQMAAGANEMRTSGSGGIVRTRQSMARIGGQAVRISNVVARSGQMALANEAAADNLTRADLGKVSETLKTAQSREVIALTTMSKAIDAYGNFASSLMDNVQTTRNRIQA
ncbi:MAG: hypothetical protein RLZZ157_967 [Pseudomonadota bacterium]